MSQHDYILDNANGATFRSDANNALAAIATNNAGASAPTVTYANMWWADTTANQLKKRNNANTAWVILGALDTANLGLLPLSGGVMTGMLQKAWGTDITAAATTDLGAVAGNAVTVNHTTGTVAITSFGGASVAKGTPISVRFNVSGGSLSITHNATSMILPGGNNITISDEDVLTFIKETTGSSNWRLIASTQSGIVKNKLESVTASTAANALTATFNGGVLDFRNPTLTNGTPIQLSVASNSITIPTAASLGVPTGKSGRLLLLEAYNGGSPVLCVSNQAGGVQLYETNLISPTTISAGSTSASVIYSASAVSANSPYRVVGFVDCVWTSGTGWSSPTLAQPVGGMAIKAVNPASMVRLNTCNGYGSTNTHIRRFTNVVNNQGADITYADSATLGGSFTINTPGVYAINYSCQKSFASSPIGISLNSNQLTTHIASITASDVVAIDQAYTNTAFASCGATLYLNAGDVIRVHEDSGAGTAAQFVITRVS